MHWIGAQFLVCIFKQHADSTYNLRISLTICGFHFVDSATAQINDTNVLSFVCGIVKTNSSRLRKHSCGFRKLAYFGAILRFWRYKILNICLWNVKQHRRTKKSSNFASSPTNLILACCGFRLHCRECTVWSNLTKQPLYCKTLTHPTENVFLKCL